MIFLANAQRNTPKPYQLPNPRPHWVENMRLWAVSAIDGAAFQVGSLVEERNHYRGRGGTGVLEMEPHQYHVVMEVALGNTSNRMDFGSAKGLASTSSVAPISWPYITGDKTSVLMYVTPLAENVENMRPHMTISNSKVFTFPCKVDVMESVSNKIGSSTVSLAAITEYSPFPVSFVILECERVELTCVNSLGGKLEEVTHLVVACEDIGKGVGCGALYDRMVPEGIQIELGKAHWLLRKCVVGHRVGYHRDRLCWFFNTMPVRSGMLSNKPEPTPFLDGEPVILEYMKYE
eukprot:PhF_6_TR19942/c0_g1_i1/m.29022